MIQKRDPATVDARRVRRSHDESQRAVRARYLQTHATYTAAQLHALAGTQSERVSEPASTWIRQQLVFAVQHQGTAWFPAFQFTRRGAPREILAAVLHSLPEPLRGGWEAAFWFASANVYCDGAPPEQCLDRRELLLRAAAAAAVSTVG